MATKNEIIQAKEELAHMNFWVYESFSWIMNYEEKEKKIEALRNYIKTKVDKLLLLEVLWVWGDRKDKLPEEIKRFSDFAEWILKYYILKVNDQIYKVFVGCSWGSTPRENDARMQEFLQDPDIAKKLEKIQVRAEDLME